MTASRLTRTGVAALAAAVALLLAAGTGAAGTPGTTSGEKADEFVPWVTDFGREPRASGRPVTSGPSRPAAPQPAPATVEPRRWSDVALGAGLGLLLAAAAGGAGLLARAVRSPSEGGEAAPAGS